MLQPLTFAVLCIQIRSVSFIHFVLDKLKMLILTPDQEPACHSHPNEHLRILYFYFICLFEYSFWTAADNYFIYGCHGKQLLDGKHLNTLPWWKFHLSAYLNFMTSLQCSYKGHVSLNKKEKENALYYYNINIHPCFFYFSFHID